MIVGKCSVMKAQLTMALSREKPQLLVLCNKVRVSHFHLPKNLAHFLTDYDIMLLKVRTLDALKNGNLELRIDTNTSIKGENSKNIVKLQV